MADDQIESTCLGLQAADPNTVEMLSITTEDGIDTVAFAFREVLDQYGGEVLEVAMDSTCETLPCCFENVELTS